MSYQLSVIIVHCQAWLVSACFCSIPFYLHIVHHRVALYCLLSVAVFILLLNLWLVGWLVGWLVDWLIGWLIHWLIVHICLFLHLFLLVPLWWINILYQMQVRCCMTHCTVQHWCVTHHVACTADVPLLYSGARRQKMPCTILEIWWYFSTVIIRLLHYCRGYMWNKIISK